MKPFDRPEWEIVLFSGDVIRTSKTLPIDWFITPTTPDPNPNPGTGGQV